VKVYLARRDVESTGAQVYSLPLINEGQDEDNTGALWRTDPTQTEHDYPLVVRHCLFVKELRVDRVYFQKDKTP